MILFVRHGETDANVRLLANNADSEEADEPLNETGRQQVSATAEALKNEKIDVILSSPYKRAVETAEIINKHHNLPILLDINLRERDGVTKTLDEWHDAFDFGKTVEFNGEQVREFFGRVYAVIEGIKEKYGDKNVLVSSHGGVNHVFRAYFNNLPWQGNLRVDKQKNGDIRRYDFNEREKK